MWSSVPFPGFKASFMVDTIRRVHRIQAPVLVIHGENDQVTALNRPDALRVPDVPQGTLHHPG
jgi:alpha-beta hydrolase superfamily lysophospholipase